MRFSTILGTLAVAAISVLAVPIQKKRNAAGCFYFSDPVHNVDHACECLQSNGTYSFYEWNPDAGLPNSPSQGDGCLPPWALFGPGITYIPWYDPKGGGD